MSRNTQEYIDRVVEYRGLPPLRKGMACEVAGKPGRVWGGNSSANLNIKFDETGQINNCHPYWKMRIFDKAGNAIYESDE